MRVRPKAYRTSSLIIAWCLIIGIAGALLRIGFLFSAQIAPPDFTEASRRAWALAKFSLGVGALTTALVQIVRVLIPIRGYFHRQQLLDWLGWSGDFPELLAKRFSEMPQHHRTHPAERALFEFETRGGNSQPSSLHTRDLYDSSIEQLCAQLNVAMETALDNPQHMPNLLLCFFGEEGIRPLEILYGYHFWDEPDREFTQSMDDPELLRKAEARARLTRLAQFRIDAFQIATGGRWRRYLRLVVTLTSLTISFAVTTGSTWHNGIGLDSERQIASIALYSVAEGLIAAFVAMFLRDLVVIVETRRRRP